MAKDGGGEMAKDGGEMQLAQILSDLVSLGPDLCHPTAALALVSARPSSTSASTHHGPENNPEAHREQGGEHDKDEDADTDLHRARQLVHLHYAVRERCRTGELARELEDARRAVERALG